MLTNVGQNPSTLQWRSQLAYQAQSQPGILPPHQIGSQSIQQGALSSGRISHVRQLHSHMFCSTLNRDEENMDAITLQPLQRQSSLSASTSTPVEMASPCMNSSRCLLVNANLKPLQCAKLMNRSKLIQSQSKLLLMLRRHCSKVIQNHRNFGSRLNSLPVEQLERT